MQVTECPQKGWRTLRAPSGPTEWRGPRQMQRKPLKQSDNGLRNAFGGFWSPREPGCRACAGASMEAAHPDEGRYWMWMNSVLSGRHGTVGTTQSWSLRDSEVFSLCSHTTAGVRMANQIDGALILVSGVFPFMVSRWGLLFWCPCVCSQPTLVTFIAGTFLPAQLNYLSICASWAMLGMDGGVCRVILPLG